MNSSDVTPTGATVVITHRVRAGKEADYENWVGEIGPLARAAPGHMDWQIIRPIVGLTTTYTVVIRFDTIDHLRRWIGSDDRQRLIEKVRPLLATDDEYTIQSGLDFLFTPPNTGGKVPVRWKQFLITWSAIYPLVLGVPVVVAPAMRQLRIAENLFATTLVVTATVVFLMVYVIMPRYTRLVRRWLYD